MISIIDFRKMIKVINPKSEYRNGSKQYRIYKIPMSKTKAAVQGEKCFEEFRTLEYSNFEFVSSFEFRASNFVISKNRGSGKSPEPLFNFIWHKGFKTTHSLCRS